MKKTDQLSKTIPLSSSLVLVNYSHYPSQDLHSLKEENGKPFEDKDLISAKLRINKVTFYQAQYEKEAFTLQSHDVKTLLTILREMETATVEMEYGEISRFDL